MAEANAVNMMAADELTDEVLLERYTSRREEAAFAALVKRYSPLVLGVCRRVLHHEQDAEDAFQAVFCVLARKAGTIRQRAGVGAWLHAVACRMARKARARRGQQPVSQSNLPDIPAAEGTPEWAWKELRPILDAEVNRLPKKCRQVFILCYLEGLTSEQAAAQLGCPAGTVRSGLARARELLSARLTRRGLALSAGTLAALLGQHAAATTVRAVLAQAAVQTGLRYAAGEAIGTSVATLADGFLKMLPRTRVLVAVGLVSASAVVIAVWFLLWPRPQAAGVANPAPPANVAVTPESERAKLQGRWQVVTMANAGQRAPGQRDMGFRFEGNRWAMLVQGHWSPLMPFTLDLSQEPRAIDCTVMPGMIYRGIYRFDGETLTLGLNFVSAEAGGKRPTTFDTRPGDQGTTVFELRRDSADPGGP